MNRIIIIFLAAIISGAAMFGPLQASGGQKSDPTSAEAWSGGNASGAGTFMSYCTPCHGDSGNGEGVLSDSLDVKPRNLSDANFLSSKSDEHLFKVIKEGGVAVGLTENMTPFDGQLSDEEIGNVIVYLRKEICKCEHKK